MPVSHRLPEFPLWRAARRFGSSPALVQGPEEISFQELADNVSRLVARPKYWLPNLNMARPDRPVFIRPTANIPTVMILWACWVLGREVILLPPGESTKSLTERLREIFLGPENPAMSDGPRENEIQPENWLDLSQFDFPEIWQSQKKAMPEDTPPVLAPPESGKSFPHSKWTGFARPVSSIFSSGSTGRPNLIRLTGANHWYNARGAATQIPFEPGHRWLFSLPPHHVGGLSLLFRSVRGGGALVFPTLETTNRGYQPPGTSFLRQSRVTHCSLVPTQLARWLDSPPEIPDDFVVLLGGAPLSPDLLNKARQALPRARFFYTYGLSEMASQVCTREVTRDGLLSGGKGVPVGRALPFRHLRRSHPKGELLVAGPCRAPGFSGATRDRCWRDRRGNFYILGRLDNMFVSGGENIQPEEIEHMFKKLPEIDECLVIWQPHPEWGQQAVALLRLREPGRELSGEPFAPAFVARVRSRLKKELPGYKIPRVMAPLDPLLGKSGGLKLPREEIRQIWSRWGRALATEI